MSSDYQDEPAGQGRIVAMYHVPKWSSIDTVPEWGGARVSVGDQFARLAGFHKVSLHHLDGVSHELLDL
jgi:hypothetical protein